MTTPRDDIAGLSERLRKTLGCVEPDDFRGDNLAIFIASELEPSIDDETLDDSMTWKQGALDACDRVLDAIHAHYATQLDSLLKERFKLITDLADMKSRAMSAEQERDALQARVKELESGIAHAHYRSDNCDAENQSLYNCALRAEQERDEAYERVIQAVRDERLIDPVDSHDQTYNRALDHAEQAIRRLAGPEKEGKE